MSNAVYEKIGRRVVELLAQNAQFAKAPNKGTGGNKNKCKPTSQSCGLSCISGKKVCRITMTMEQQKTAKNLKKELQSTPKAEAKTEPEISAGSNFEAEKISQKELQNAWLKLQSAAYYEYLKIKLKEATVPSAINHLKDELKSRKKDENKKIGEPTRDTKTIGANSAIAQGMIFSNNPIVAIKQSGRISAAFTYLEEKGSKPLYIEYLATSPENMFSGTTPVKGAGTAAIKAMVAESIKQGKKGAVKLEPIPDALDFYKKMGFVIKGEHMILSAEKAKQYL
jgi:hypothetical protein